MSRSQRHVMAVALGAVRTSLKPLQLVTDFLATATPDLLSEERDNP